MAISIPIAILMIAGLLLTFNKPSGYVQLGNILLGAGLTLGATFVVENWKRARLRSDLAAALYSELANRVARCCIDFDAPWSGYWEHHPRVDRFGLGKFLPEPTTIFNANADKLSLFPRHVPITLMAFYFRLWVVRRDIENAREEAAAKDPSDIGAWHVRIVSTRFAATLRPGLDALNALAPLVPHFAAIEAGALDTMDPQKLRFDGTLREFISKMIEKASDIRSRAEAKGK